MNFGIILASGNGKRMHNTTPKQFLLAKGKPLVYYSILAFENCDNIDEIIIVTQKKYFRQMYEIIDQNNIHKVHMLVEGGKTRQESSYNALKALQDYAIKSDLVIIHDAARPLIKTSTIEDMIKTSKRHSAITLANAVWDTIVTNKQNHYDQLLDRSSLVTIQTPQTFKYGLILKAHENAKNENITNASDDAQLVNNIHKKVYLLKNKSLNFKITTPMDLELLENILSRGD